MNRISFLNRGYAFKGLLAVVMVRASASGTGGRGFDPGPHYTKDAKNNTSGYLARRSAFTHGKH